MFQRFSTNQIVLFFLVDLLAVQMALSWGMRLRFLLPWGQPLLPAYVPTYVYAPTLALHIAVGLLWAASLLLGSVYMPRRLLGWGEECQRLCFSHTVAALSLAGLLYLAKQELPRLTFGYFYLLALAALLAYRAAWRLWPRSAGQPARTRILVVGAGKVGCGLVAQLRKQPGASLEVVGFLDDDADKLHATIAALPVLGRLDEAVPLIHQFQIDEVIIALPLHAHVRLRNLVARLYAAPVQLHVVPDYFDLAFHAATMDSVGGLPLIGLRDPALDGFQRFVKRLTDLLVASVGLLVVCPLLALVALAIKCEDGGPVFYRAVRVGENGRLFRMFKFRSMVPDADQQAERAAAAAGESGRRLKQRGDPRVTQVGRLLRRSSLDELPQLVNVLRGEMSLVGPRPELPWLVQTYEPWQRKRFAVPQGMTGWWQINGRSENPMHLHTEQDLYYIQHYSWWLDIRILWRTISVVLRGKGAF